MAAISKAWVTIADGAVDPDSPVDATLMTGLRDDNIHLREWLGASFFAGAVQDHNHDGLNSALVPIGPNLLRNGSFEDNGSGWTITTYTGGSSAFSTSTRYHGDTSLSITSTVAANGGGDAVSNEFIPISGNRVYLLNGILSASAANISARIQIIWYDAAQAQISTKNIADLTNAPTTETMYEVPLTSPATARFAKVKVIGGVPGVGTGTGTIFFDGLLSAELPKGCLKLLAGSASGAATVDIVLTDFTAFKHKLIILRSLKPATDNVSIFVRLSTNGGSTYDTGAGQYAYHMAYGGSDTTVSHTAGTDSSIVLGTGIGSVSTEGISSLIQLHNTTDATVGPRVTIDSHGVDFNAIYWTRRQGWHRQAAQDTDAIRVLASSGNISVDYEVYGFN